MFVVLEIPAFLLYIINILPSRRSYPSEATIDLSSATFKRNTNSLLFRPICVIVPRQSRDFVTLITKFCTSNERRVETFNEVSSVNFRTFPHRCPSCSTLIHAHARLAPKFFAHDRNIQEPVLCARSHKVRLARAQSHKVVY